MTENEKKYIEIANRMNWSYFFEHKKTQKVYKDFMADDVGHKFTIEYLREGENHEHRALLSVTFSVNICGKDVSESKTDDELFSKMKIVESRKLTINSKADSKIEFFCDIQSVLKNLDDGVASVCPEEIIREHINRIRCTQERINMLRKSVNEE